MLCCRQLLALLIAMAVIAFSPVQQAFSQPVQAVRETAGADVQESESTDIQESGESNGQKLVAEKVHDRTTENTLATTEGIESAAATLEDVSWLTGNRSGEGLGGTAHESWDTAIGGTMTATFRLFQNEQFVFSEFIMLTEVDGTLKMQLKHYGADMAAWEEKDDWTEFPLLKIESGGAWFDGLTYQLDDEGRLHVYVAMDHSDEVSEGHFVFEREAVEK